MEANIGRYALVSQRGSSVEQIERYMPGNYVVIATDIEVRGDDRLMDGPYAMIAGKDTHGWTLDGYVIPRLLSGLIACSEIDLSHPAMKEVPAEKPWTVPWNALRIRLPFSEVCMHMKVADTFMWVAPVSDTMAQLYTLAGEKFSIPVTRGEAGYGYGN